MRLVSVIAVVPVALIMAVGNGLAATDVPLPRARPASLAERFAVPPQSVVAIAPATALAPAPEIHADDDPFAVPGPSVCELRLGDLAAFAPLPTLIGPGECGASDMVRLDAVIMPDKARVALNPPARLRCGMAEAVAQWVRNDIGPATADLGAPLAAIANYDSYDCRGRNRVVGAKLSEHGRGNALDVRAIKLANGTMVELTNPIVSKDFRDRIRLAACGRFMTVLGPGSDGYHESHVHVDLAERARGYRMCQWDVREPPLAVDIPLPLPRPTLRTDAGLRE